MIYGIKIHSMQTLPKSLKIYDFGVRKIFLIFLNRKKIKAFENSVFDASKP